MSQRQDIIKIILVGIPLDKQPLFIEAFRKLGCVVLFLDNGREVIKVLMEMPIYCVVLGPGKGHVIKTIRSLCTVPCLNVLCKDCPDVGGAERVVRCDGSKNVHKIVTIVDELITVEKKEIRLFKGAVRCAEFVIDMDRYTAKLGDAEIKLKPMEMRILYYLMKLRNRVVGREQLMENVWRYEGEVNTKTVDVHLMNLRQSLERYDVPFRILTLRGIGYRLADK